jgi:hypothetical protein
MTIFHLIVAGYPTQGEWEERREDLSKVEQKSDIYISIYIYSLSPFDMN